MSSRPDRGDASPAPCLVSACLLGRACRFDGGSRPVPALLLEARHRPFVAVCPEELGGLDTPRPPAELRGGDGAAVWAGRARVVRPGDGVDVTEAFTRGAERAAALGRGAGVAVLKARSPSCGVGVTRIDGGEGAGDGVFAALLRRLGVELCDDEAFVEGGRGRLP